MTKVRLASYWTRLASYLGPARVVSRVRLGSYQALLDFPAVPLRTRTIFAR
jgi:hypothetical protein